MNFGLLSHTPGWLPALSSPWRFGIGSSQVRFTWRELHLVLLPPKNAAIIIPLKSALQEAFYLHEMRFIKLRATHESGIVDTTWFSWLRKVNFVLYWRESVMFSIPTLLL